MKIKCKQLTEKQRNTLAIALDYYVGGFKGYCDEEIIKEYTEMGMKIRHGELILCQYEYEI